MFDFVNRKKHIVQIIMALAVLPFLFWGVESYRSDGKEGFVAIVDGEEIQRREFEQALRDHHERMRATLGNNFDSSLMDSFEVRNSVLERLIQQRLLQREAVNHGFTVLDSQVVKAISEAPAFQRDSKFSKQQYESLLRSQGITPSIFESRVRQELLLQQLLDGYSEYGFVPDVIARKVMYLSEVQREISQVQIEPDLFLSQVEPEEVAISAYYDKHKNDFNLPERAKVEYLVLSMNDVAKNEPVSEEAVSQYFNEHSSEFGQSEERKASHILFSVSTDVPDEEKQAIQEKARDVLERVKQNPDQFSELAKEYSNDSGSADRGGDLGFFGRGVMVKAFEDEIFQMQPDEIRGLVETNFGFHIIQLTEIKEAKLPDIEEVREQIEKKLRIQMVASNFGEIAEDFSNVVYEQSDSLQAAAEKFELTIQSSDWITRNSAKPSILSNEKLLSAIFSEDLIQSKRNTAAIEVAPDTLVSVRILEHKPATAQSLMMVKEEIVEKLKKQMAIEKATEEGKAKLARLQAGDDGVVEWNDVKLVSYMQSQGISYEVLQAIFKAELKELPTYAGVENPKGGYSLIRISQVVEPSPAEEMKRSSFNKQLQQMIIQEEMSSYLAGLRQRHEVKIKLDNF